MDYYCPCKPWPNNALTEQGKVYNNFISCRIYNFCFGQETACSPVEAEQLVFPVELILI